MGMAVIVHLFPPSLDNLRGLSQDIGGSAGDDLDLVLGRKIDAGRRGAHSLEQRRMGLLQRLGQYPQVVYVGELAMVGQFLFGPGLLDHIDRLVEPLPTSVDVDAETVELLALVAGTDTQIEASTADYIDHRGFFRHQDGVVQGQHHHGGADSDVLGPASDQSGEGPDARQQAVAGEAVLAQPYFVDAQLVGQFNLLQCFIE